MNLLIEAGILSKEDEEQFMQLCTAKQIGYAVWNPDGRPPFRPNDHHVFFIGSIQTALKLQNAGFQYNIWIGPSFDFSAFAGHFRDIDLLNSDYNIGPHGHLLDVLAEHPNAELFTRSNSGYKKLTGDVRNYSAYVNDTVGLDMGELIVTANTKYSIVEEIRCVVRSSYNEESDIWVNKIITLSSYTGTEVTNLNVLVPYIEDILNSSNYHPYPMWVLDVTVLDDLTLRLIESNSISTCGFYDCDKSVILDNLKEIFATEVQNES